MEVDRQRFLEEGYVIVRQVVPPDQLEELRRVYEVLVDRQRAIWARDRAPGDPPGGHWETGAQPRLILTDMAGEIDAPPPPPSRSGSTRTRTASAAGSSGSRTPG